MSYRQIMRHSNCRVLMKQELAAAEPRHRHSAHRHQATAHKSAGRHHATKRRR
jgi:hypothetical protein